LVIAGAPDSKKYQNELKAMIRKYELHERVKLLGRISVEEKLNLYARALAVLFIPYDEDYGFITLEAGYAQKPVITCRDSGGPLEFIRDKETGLVCEPDSQTIADAIEVLVGDRARARRLGQQASEHVKTMNLSWDRVAEELTK
jgi:glycosyltransferase involved in cell wall biosynthesis